MPRRSWWQRIVLSAGVLVVLVALTGAAGAVWIMREINSVGRTDVAVDELPPGEPANFLIVGSDSREGENSEFGDSGGQRSDSMMLLRVDPKTESAQLTSLPRDLMVDIPGEEGKSQLNAAFNSAQGGSDDLLTETIRQNFQVEIHRYVEVDFVGFQRLVDSMGGIEINFPYPIRDGAEEGHDSGLLQPAGCVTLDGTQALAYMRARSLQYLPEDGDYEDDGDWETDGFADITRMRRQQLLVEIALGQVLGELKSHPLRLRELFDIAGDNVQLDNKADAFDLADQFRDFKLQNLQTLPLPVDNWEEDENRVVLKQPEASKILNVFRGLEPDAVSPDLITVDVQNGTDPDKTWAADAAGALQQIGFDIGSIDDYDGDLLARTTVFYAPGEENNAKGVARYVTGPVDRREDEDLESGHTVLVTGPEFRTIHTQPTPLDQLPTAEPSTTTTTTAPPSSGEEEQQAPTTPPITEPEEPTQYDEFVIGQAC